PPAPVSPPEPAFLQDPVLGKLLQQLVGAIPQRRKRRDDKYPHGSGVASDQGIKLGDVAGRRPGNVAPLSSPKDRTPFLVGRFFAVGWNNSSLNRPVGPTQARHRCKIRLLGAYRQYHATGLPPFRVTRPRSPPGALSLRSTAGGMPAPTHQRHRARPTPPAA